MKAILLQSLISNPVLMLLLLAVSTGLAYFTYDSHGFTCPSIVFSAFFKLEQIMDVFLTHGSFVSLISSVIEGYDDEVMGVIFGDLVLHSGKRRKARVSHAIPLQRARRKKDSVEPDEEAMKRVIGVWDNITPYWPLGDFHSHPDDGTRLSETDNEGMKKRRDFTGSIDKEGNKER